MSATDEFSFATLDSIHKLFASRPSDRQRQIFQRLNQAHPILDSDTFLGWRLDSGSKGVR
jgi:hypothetical protein